MPLRSPMTIPTRAAAAPKNHKPDAATDEDRDGDAKAQPESAIIGSAHRLDAARTSIDQGLGATVFELYKETIENRPGGKTGSIRSILSQTPGVTLSGPGINIPRVEDCRGPHQRRNRARGDFRSRRPAELALREARLFDQPLDPRADLTRVLTRRSPAQPF